MFNAQYLFKDGYVFSPWMEREGDNLRVTAELITQNPDTGTMPDLEIAVFHKNSEDTGDGDNADGSTTLSITSPGRGVAEWTGLKELVRYRMHVTGNAASDYILFRTLAPVWFNAVLAPAPA